MITEYPKFTTKTVGGVEIVTVRNLGKAYGSPRELGQILGKSHVYINQMLAKLQRTHRITILKDDRGALSINIPEFVNAFVETHQYTKES